MEHAEPLVTNDAVVLGLLACIIGFVFYTERSPHAFWRGFYRYVPALLMCYFLPSLLNTFNVVDAEQSRLYFVSSRYLLPACLVLLTLSIDLPAIVRLGYKAVVLFLTGTVSIMLGGPLAILLVSAISPEILGGSGPDAVWRGMTTVAGSWIGGGANQAAMKEVFERQRQPVLADGRGGRPRRQRLDGGPAVSCRPRAAHRSAYGRRHERHRRHAKTGRGLP